MNQIKCPNCGEVFTIDESSYDSIVKQIRDHQFNEELRRREKDYEEKLRMQLDALKQKTLSENLKALNEKDLQIEKLKSELSGKEKENELLTKEAVDELQARLQEKENLIVRLDADLKNKEMENKVDLAKAVAEKEEEITHLKAESDALKQSYVKQLADKDELIAYYKDFKAKQSTKMIGEDLEQHCLYEFNRVRPLFRNAYFEKDNDISQGSKGDFIFRDYDDEGTQIVSIMFEMKNEADQTATKHKNEDFLAKLDKDRKDKKCEYAVLVSLLETDNDLYNEGIVDMSHRYEKMYVVRPQNFIPIITLLRNANMNSLSYKKQLIALQEQDVDFKNFENNMNAFKEAFGKNYTTAAKKFNDAIEEIDKSIAHLNKIKEALTSSSNQLRLANDKAQDLSIRKLTRNAPSVAEKFKQ
ncbi:MAG: DUF2130 domain-containing protein [Erysipelotrichaceae bacterium]|nr:DUF2130 domain-containing protein [Erysipelotrichaceae bacterium]MBQ1482967.1 DUF2130 domain-containing protein [Erysipelotrichaceae bacterium]